jgi:hypothetical protein
VTARLWFAVLAGHVGWSAHLLVSYVVASRACADGDQLLGLVRSGMTILAVAICAAGGVVAWTEQREEPAAAPGPAGQLAGRAPPFERRFVAQVGLVLNSIFLTAILLAGVASATLAPCA